MHVQQVQELIATALAEMKAIDIKVIEVSAMTSMMDSMIIASGNSDRHVKSLSNHCIATAKANGIKLIGTEGYEFGEWVLVDFGEVIVHIMQPNIRDFYHLEKLWSQHLPTAEENLV